MTDRPMFHDIPNRRTRPLIAEDQTSETLVRQAERSFWSTLDKPLLVMVGLLLAVGAGMVYSATFDWSYQTRGSETAFFLEDHLRNVVIAIAGLAFFARIDYRFWRRFAVLLLLFAIAVSVGVLLFGDDVYGARRSLIAGRFQPGELAAFAVVVYMAAWLGARNSRPDSLLYLIVFGLVLTLVCVPVALQPDLSTAAIIGLTALTVYFLAGARLLYLGTAFIGALVIGLIFIQLVPYAQDRLDSYVVSLTDPTQANYHTQQAIIAFVNGGWTGLGLGQGKQKFGYLPAPHTDSIFAVIGEELGVLGAGFVVLLYVVFIIRGFQIARRAVDPFGSLMTIGFTMWIAIQAMTNIAVMTNVIPSSGLPLPFISYGGSSLLVLMCGVGLTLSVNRVALLRQTESNRSKYGATYDWSRRHGRSRLPRPERR
jgi:cell division protein FtsW